MHELIDKLEEGEYSDMTKIAEFIGVVADRNTAWESLQLGELKAMLYLALGELESAKEWVTWCRHMANLDDERTSLYKCLDAMLHIRLEQKVFDEYSPSLVQMYGKDCVDNCKEIIAKRLRFHGLHSPGLNLDGFETHMRLLQGYEKVQKAKRDFDSTKM